MSYNYNQHFTLESWELVLHADMKLDYETLLCPHFPLELRDRSYWSHQVSSSWRVFECGTRSCETGVFVLMKTAHESHLMIINHKHDIFLYLWEVKSKSGFFWNHTSSTLGYCSLILSNDWLTTRWVDQEKSKHCHRLCHSVPVCRPLSVHIRLRLDTHSQPFSPSSPLCFSSQPWGQQWPPLSWWCCAWWWCTQTWSRREISPCRG